MHGTGGRVNCQMEAETQELQILVETQNSTILGNHFIDNPGCLGPEENPWANMKFTIIDCLDNVENLTVEQIDHELLKKEKMWIRKLLTYHHGMNSSHDLNRTRRCEREKLD